MNLAQRIVLIIGFLVVLAMALFPPWKRQYDVRRYDLRHVEESTGYHLILVDQSSGDESGNLRIDTTRLAVQFIAVSTLTFMLYLILLPARK